MSRAAAGTPLSGRRVLIVEDRYLIAAEISDQVRRLGAEVLGPAPSIAVATEILRDEVPDVALLDVNLDGEAVFPLAEALTRTATSIVFVTGYNDDLLPAAWRGRTRLTKPLDPKLLRETLFHLAQAEPGPAPT